MSSSSSPCAACKFLRRKCPQECVFAPYFPPDQPQRFVNVHKVFGASNVAKILNELPPNQREDAVNSLAYEAEARLRDPVYGCVGLISILQQTLKQIRMDLDNAKNELAALGGLAAGVMQHHMIHQDPFIHTQFHPNSIGAPAVSTAGPSNNPNLMHYNMALAAQMMGIPGGGGGGPVQGPGGHGAGGLMIGENKLQPQQVELGVVGARGQLMMRDQQQQQQHPGVGGVQLLIREPNNMLQQQHHQNSQSQSHITDQPSQQVMEEQQLAAAMQVKEEQELMRNLEQQQQQQQHGHHLHYQSQHQHQQYLRFSGDFDNSRGPSMASAGHGLPGPSAVDQGDGEGSGGGTGGGGGRFGKMNSPTTVFDHMSPSLALGSGYNSTSSTTFQINHPHLHHNQHHHHQQEQQHHQLAPLMLLQALEPHHHHTQQQQSSDVEASQIIPQQFFQEQPGRSGGASQDDGRHSSSSSVGTSFREDFQKVNL